LDEKEMLIALIILDLEHMINPIQTLFLEKIPNTLLGMYDEDPVLRR
jgi:hypothetical protein